MTDDKTRQLENRIETLENTIEKMVPSRRDALKMGGAALIGGAAMSGTASAGTNQVGTIGSASQPVDLESEDINNADTVTTDTLDSTTVNADDIDAVSANTDVLNNGGLATQEIASTSNTNTFTFSFDSALHDGFRLLLTVAPKVGSSDITLTARDAADGDYRYVTQAGANFTEVSGANSIDLSRLGGEGVLDVTVTFTTFQNYALAAVGSGRGLEGVLSQGFIVSGGTTENFTLTVIDGEDRIERAVVTGFSFL